MTEHPHLPNPFPGLRPFEAAETHLFFGRDGQASEIVSRLERRRFVAVVGTSGSGKSSLVRAGLLPMLEGGFMASAGARWRFAAMRPGSDPIRNLAATLADPAVLGDRAADQALRAAALEAVLRRSERGLVDAYRQARLPPGESLLVVVDQFEELFRFRRLGPAGAPGDDGAALVALLLEAARDARQPLFVVLTMRSDFLGDCARFRGLPEALNDGQYLIPRLTRDQRRAAVEGPVAVGGAAIAPRLTQRLLNDAGDSPDALPVLQHALMRTWDQWAAAGARDRPLDLEHYLAVGGMAEALSHHADQAYAGLASMAGGQALAQVLFRSLCERGTDFRETRRPTRLADLCEVAGADAATVTRVIDAFRRDGRTFLVPGWPEPLGPDAVIDISHESLIRQWRTLAKWVEQEARSAVLYRRLSQTAQLWPQSAALWRNPDLERALLWEREERPTAPWAARYGSRTEFARAMEFLRASEAAWRQERDREAQAARAATARELELLTQRDREARLQAEVRALQSRKRMLSAVAVLVPALLAGLGWAWSNRNEAMRLARTASAEAARANGEAIRAQQALRQAEQLTERLTNANRLKLAFLRGDAEAIRRIAQGTTPDPELRFGADRRARGWKLPGGKEVYTYSLFPTAESLAGPLRTASQISYYMNHETFDVKLMSAGAGSRFTASYTGWGCLTKVYVLVEFADPDTPPKLTWYDQCEAIP